MAIKNLENPIFHLDDPSTGAPLIGGKVYIYAAGTTNSITTWQDSSQSTANTNPVILDSYGNAKIWFNQDAKIVAKNSDDSITYYTFDNVSPVGGTTTVSGNYNLALNGSFESGTGTDVTNWTLTPYDSSVTIGIDTTNVSHGKQALKFDGVTAIGGGTATSAKFDVTADTLLSVSLDTMASNATTTNDVQVFWYKKDDTASATPSTTLGLPAEGSYPTSMTNYAFLTAVPSDATRAEIKITGIDSGGSNLDQDVWFDNILVLDNQTIASASVTTPVTYLKASAGATGVNPSVAAEGEANTGVEIKDSNGNEILINESVANAVNEVTITNAATGVAPKIDQTGSDDVGLVIEGILQKNATISTNTLNGNLDLQRNGTGDITVDTVPIYGMVILDTPEQLASGLTEDAWTSSSGFASTTLSTAGATKAILKMQALDVTATTSVTIQGYIRKAGTALAADHLTRVLYLKDNDDATASTAGSAEFIVNLDSSSDFEYYLTCTEAGAVSESRLILVGYYV